MSQLKNLHSQIDKLNISQKEIISDTIRILSIPFEKNILVNSDIFFNTEIINCLGDYLKIHHSFSKEPFTKDKFEYALERVFNTFKIPSKLATKGNPGHDITINGKKISLKTQAERNIKVNELHISKFMELGKGEWEFEKLRDQFFNHLKNYEFIFTLRCLTSDEEKENGIWNYELVKIPKEIFLEAKNGSFRWANSNTTPKSGYCDITDKKNNSIKYHLYFDGGGERKLQITHLKKIYCVIIAEWKFSI
jgi:hypothetical protein